MKSTDSIISDITRDVYEDIRHSIISSDPVIDDIIRQIFAQRGKAMRPLFMALCGNLVEGTWETIRKPAMIVEAIHIASLIHDDVVDGSDLRRGKETLNARFSDKVSVLFGDYVFVKAFSIAHTICEPDVVRIIHRAVERMLEGEINEAISGKIIDEETYLKIIGNKTASLFAASGELGIICSGADGIERKWAGELGESVGTAFQIIDDTLDFTGETEVMGKPRFVDVMSGRITLPVIFSLKDLPHDEIEDIFADKDGSIEKITTLVRNNGGIEYSYEKALEYSNKAQNVLENFNNKEAISVFEEFFDMLLTRAH